MQTRALLNSLIFNKNDMLISEYEEYSLKVYPDLIAENIRRLDYALIDDSDVLKWQL